MGAHRASQLARAGRLTEVRQGALGELDAAFGTDRAPFCGTVFVIARKRIAVQHFSRGEPKCTASR